MAITCKGSILKQYVSSALAAIGQITSIDGPNPELEQIEVDYLDNTNKWIPKMGTGRANGGTMNASCWYLPANSAHKALIDLIETPGSTPIQWGVDYSEATALTLTAFLQSFGESHAVGAALVGNFTLNVATITYVA